MSINYQAYASMFQKDFPPEEFAERRGKIFDGIGEGAHALLQGAPPGRGFTIFRQTNEFYQCSGVELPQAYLLLGGAERKTALYLPSRGKEQTSEGTVLGAEDAEVIKHFTGVDEVFPTEKLAEDLENVSVLYTPHSPAETRGATRWDLLMVDKQAANDPWEGLPSREQRFIGLLRTRFPKIEIHNLSPILDGLRAIKSPAEIDLMRRAGQLCALAIREAMRVTRPGIIEYQLGALAEYVYLLNGARGQGYRPIIASGANAWFSHYFRNNCAMKDGDLVLMDVAPECGYYTSDIGRMWPVYGIYAPWQRELYGFMVEYHKVLLSKIRPDVTADQVMDEAAAEMKPVFEGWHFSKRTYREAAGRTLEFRGHLSHPVGMAVHDVGGYRARPLVPGVVFSVDPQMWIPEEKLYIRVEDTGVVTNHGFENFTSGAPLELDDVEALMRDEGIPLPFLPE